jgi:hypothetical protein
MVGGTHADHADVEAWLGISLGAATKPFTDAHVDAMCVKAEALIQGHLPQGVSLPTTASTEWEGVVVQVVLNMMDRADKWQRSRGAITESGEATGSATFPDFGADVITARVAARIRELVERMSSSEGASSGDTVDTTD